MYFNILFYIRYKVLYANSVARRMWLLIWVRTVCIGPIKETLGTDWLNVNFQLLYDLQSATAFYFYVFKSIYLARSHEITALLEC